MNFPIALTINNQSEFDTLQEALSNTQDMHTDMLCDDIPFRADEIREMAALPDSAISDNLTTIRHNTSERMKTLNILTCLQGRLYFAAEK